MANTDKFGKGGSAGSGGSSKKRNMPVWIWCVLSFLVGAIIGASGII